MKPRVIIPMGLGINSHEELKYCFELGGAEVDFIMFNALIADPSIVDDYQGMGLAGGFAMGDQLGAGQSLANRIRNSGLKDKLEEKLNDDAFPVYSVCNSLQLMAKLDLFPVLVGTARNASGKHETGFWDMVVNPSNETIWLKYLKGYDKPIFAPISHGEGRILLEVDVPRNLVALEYTAGRMYEFQKSSKQGRYNPNGSVADIAGFGWNNNLVLFPHFERLHHNFQRPDRALLARDEREQVYEPTYLMFKAAVELMKEK